MTLLRFLVTGDLPVGGIEPGEITELDPDTVDLDALKAAGHIGPVEPHIPPARTIRPMRRKSTDLDLPEGESA